MLTVTASFSQAFESQLSLRNIPDQQRRDFHKWLRIYMDFCNKYTLDPKLIASFAGFDEKLQSKGESDAQRMEARRSIAMYYRIIGTLQSPPATSVSSTTKTANNPLPSTSLGTPHPNASSQFGLPATKREIPLTLVPSSEDYRRWHLHETHVQRAIKCKRRKRSTKPPVLTSREPLFSKFLKRIMHDLNDSLDTAPEQLAKQRYDASGVLSRASA